MRAFLLSAVCAALLAAAPARADDVTEAIGEAQKAYSAGDLNGAKQALDTASLLVAQKNADRLAVFLVDPPAGWTAEPVDSGAAGSAFLGGGLIVKRDYLKGDDRVQVQLMSNSPILSSLAPMFANVQMLGVMGKVFRAKGKTAVVDESGEIQMVLGATYLTVSGQAPEADKKALLETLDLAGIERFGK